MKKLIQPFTTQLPPWLMILAAALWAIYKAVYPYINPSHLQLQDAVVAAILAIMAMLGIAEYVVARIAAMGFDGSSTRHDLPAIQRQSRRG